MEHKKQEIKILSKFYSKGLIFYKNLFNNSYKKCNDK